MELQVYLITVLLTSVLQKNAAVAAADDDNDTFKLSFGNSGQAPPYYAFFPVRTNTQEAMLNEQRGEVFDGIDLNLKL